MNGYLNISDIEVLLSINGFYTDGLDNTKKFPSNKIDKSLIARAIHKRIRKAIKNKSNRGETFDFDSFDK